MKLGFTGSRQAPSLIQMKTFLDYLQEHAPYIEEFHHGDCIGSDAAAHALVKIWLPTVWVVIHPPTNSTLRAFCKGAHATKLPRPYLERNRKIVEAADQVVALPAQMHETMKSGTWATVRYAQRLGVPILGIFPDGSSKEL